MHQETCKTELTKLIKETEKLSDEEYNNYVHIIYVDRNHPPGEFGIIEIVDDIDK